MIDPRSAQAIATLLPSVQPRFRAFLETANKAMKAHGLSVKIISGTRSYAEQEAIYAKGRTVPSDVPCRHAGVERKVGTCKAHPLGLTVTKARAGFSNHNFGVACDLGVFKGTKWLPESPAYNWLGPIGETCGLKWAGRWKDPDRPHYEYPTGLTMAQMRERVAAGKPVVA